MSSKTPSRAIKLHNVKLQMIHLLEPEDFMNKKSYKCDVLMEEGDPQIDVVRKAVSEIKEEAASSKFFTEKTYKKGANFFSPLQEGNDGMAEKYAEYKDTVYLSAKSNSQPGIIDAAKNDLTLPAYSDKVKSGMTAHVTLTLVAYEAGGKDGVTCYLNNIMLVKEGDIGRRKAEDDFGEEIESASKEAESGQEGKDDDGGF